MLLPRVTETVLGTRIEVTTSELACTRILTLARLRQPAYICFATAHMLVEASRDVTVDDAYANAAMVNPDGTPIAWCLQLMGHRTAQCVSGPRMTPVLLGAAAANGISVGFYGGRQKTLDLITAALARTYPHLRINYVYSPPFRPLEKAHQDQVLQQILDSGVQLLFVGLGSPKQERWMREFSPALPCVCLGVGAAFEFMSGEKVMPPKWVQQMGLAWLVRLCQEPRRLARRNLYSPVFVAMLFRQWLTGKQRGPGLRGPDDLAGSASE